MGVISRGAKNAFRNGIRTISIIFILTASISMALVMLIALKTVQSKIENVKSSIGNTIAISPAGVRGFEGGGELLTEQNANDLATIEHVTKVIKTATDRLNQEGSNVKFPGNDDANNTTSLVSPIEPGSFGNRQQRRTQSYGDGGPSTNITIKVPITVTGVNDLDNLTALNASKFDIVTGQKFDINSTENIAMVGKDLATKNNLSVSQTFKGYEKDIKVVGIYDAGNTFANAGIIMPIKSVQSLSGQSDQLNSLIVQADSIDSLSSIEEAIKNKLGADKIDVVSSQETAKNAIAPLQNIKTISLYSLIGSLIAGSIIIFLTMIMIVRERRREIGVLKAIGSSNIGIMAQFVTESFILTLSSSLLGIIIGFAASNPVLKVLVNNSEESARTAKPILETGRGAGFMVKQMGSNVIPGAVNLVKDLHATVGFEIILYGLLAAVFIAIIGSAFPAFFIAKIRPAEVMRAE
jgi:putative ABC transport system permease protein